MKKLNEITPHVGDSMYYLYDGSSNEKLRVCNVYAFHLFNDGPGEMEVNGKRYAIENRTLIFLRPEEQHAFHISSDRPLSSHNLYFDIWDRTIPVSVNRTFIYAPEPFVLHETAASYPCEELDSLPCVFSLQPYPELYESLVTLAKLYHNAAFYRTEMMNSLLYAWILNWYNTIHTHQPTDYRIVRLLAHLNDHPEQRESVEAWWTFCGLKRTYFHALFLRETGLTPKAYHHKLLMRRATHLLLESDMSVTAIAERLGYPSIHPFTRHFSAFYGVSPKHYRLQPHSSV
ncbi:AraC family transcriptional regulator [Paenibacillus sinopodophylli]|uniref:AraC family transcriptional regulator n=1 Tax=Paenibacillus sinopodophylli TaxID=1837342 RepID=UPI00110CF406|nr:AraC family transcriptional regulator [Paenibacillus sinopodophylli]